MYEMIDDFDNLNSLEMGLKLDFFEMEMLINEIDRGINLHNGMLGEVNLYKKNEDFGEALILTGQIESNIRQLNTLYEQFHQSAEVNNFFWNYCSERVYQRHFINFEQKFHEKIPNSKRIDFLNYEMKFLQNEGRIPSFTHLGFELDYTYNLVFEKHIKEEYKVRAQFENRKKIDFVKSEIEKEKSNAETKTKRSTSFFDKHVTIFKDNESAELFRYLDENHIDSFERAKYIDIYRYLIEDSHRIICTQNMYIEFIEQTKNLIISKITPETHKYRAKTRTILKNLNKLHLKNIEILNEE